MLKCAQDEEDKGENIENTVSSAEYSTIIELQPEA